jgi:hypothetical protein
MKSSEQRQLGTAGAGSASPGSSKETEAQFDVCFRAHYAAVLAYALRRLGERGADEDVAAQTYAVAWRPLDACRPTHSLGFFGIARHAIQNEGAFGATTIAASRAHDEPAAAGRCARSHRLSARALGDGRGLGS